MRHVRSAAERDGAVPDGPVRDRVGDHDVIEGGTSFPMEIIL